MPTYDRYVLSKQEKLRYFCICCPLISGISYLFYHSIIFCILLPLLSIPGQRKYEAYLINRQKKELSKQFRDLLYSLSASFSASKQMKEALKESLPVLLLLYGENSLLIKEISQIVRKMEESRDSEESLLSDFAERSADGEIQSFVDVYLICRKSGGNLIQVISKTVEVLIEKLDITREIQKMTAQKRFESMIITAIPLLMLLFLQCSSPDFTAVLYETLAGRLLMTLALLGTVVASCWSRKITEIDF